MLFCFIVLSFATVVNAQPNIFPSREQCEAAFLSGTYSVYEPKFFGLKETNPVDGKTKITNPLESSACVGMLTTAGKKWVVQTEGTILRWNVNADGSLGTPYSRDDCGNPIFGISYPTAPQVVEHRTPAPQPQPVVEINVVQQNENSSPIKGLDYYEKQFSGPTPTPATEQPRRSFVRRHWKGIAGLAALGGVVAYGIENCWFY